ncbi:MAG: hypothetical protein ACREGE_00120 [Candidatus Microsaccharimonas sp.]
MQILRGVKVSTKLTAFLLLALGTASSLAIIHPQPVNAEGYLFGTVRCVVRTVFNRECEKKAPPVAEEPRQDTPTPNGSGTAAPQQQAGTPAGGQQTPAYNSGGGTAVEPIEIPEELLTGYKEFELPAARTVTAGERVDESEYTAYFNTFSPYAVAGAHTTAAINEAPVQRSAEGWKLFGIAWYWWAIAGLVIVVMIVSGRSILRARTISKI